MSICRSTAVAMLVLCIAPIALAKRQAVRHPTEAAIQRVVLVIMENQNADQVMRRPFVKRLAAEGAALMNMHCIEHPSQPNYIALAAGDTWGVHDDATLTLNVRHLGDVIEERGLSWRAYAEQYPGNCFTGSNANGGLYVRRHVPFLEFQNVIANKERCNARVVNANAFDADVAAGTLPSFSMYIPDQNHNGHDTNIDTADAWLESRFGPLLRDPHFAKGTLFILTYDESASYSITDIATIFWGAGVKVGATSTKSYDLYDLLRTIEIILDTNTLGREDARTGEFMSDVLTLQ